MNPKLMFRILIFCCLNLSFYVNSSILKQESNDNVSKVCVTQDCIETAALITTSIDDTIDPCDDFYKYACGNWIKEHFVPTNATYSYSHFHKLTYEIRDRLNYKFSKGYQPDEPQYLKKLYNFYKSCADIDARNKDGIDQIRKFLKMIGGWPVIDSNWTAEKYDWEDAYVRINQLLGLSSFLLPNTAYVPLPFIVSVTPNLKNTSENILTVGSLFTLFLSFEPMEAIIKKEDPFEKYPKFDMFEDETETYIKMAADLKGSPVNSKEFLNDTANSKSFILKLNATSTKTILYNESLQGYYMKHWDEWLWSVDQLKNVTPNINWDKIFVGLLGKKITNEKILINDLTFIKNLNNLVKEMDKRMLAHFHGISLAASLIRFTNEKYHKQFIGVPIEQACYQYTSAMFHDLVSKVYLNQFDFGLKQRNHIENMVQLLKSSFSQLLDKNTWMDPTTKKVAKEKLLAIKPNVAAPDIVFDDIKLEKDSEQYGDLNETYLLNVIKWFDINNRKLYESLGKDSKTEGKWPSGLDEAQTVNAFYAPDINQIFLPAGIANTPFYAFNRPLSANLGSIGVIIGHELTHGFDNQGSKYDLHGQYKNWWTNETLEKFQAKNQCFIKQYSKFNVTGTNQTINGGATLGENIADNGGMREAFYALQNYQKQSKGNPIDKLPGDLQHLSDEKVFFLSFATQWCENKDINSAKQLLKLDVHSPPHARVVLSLANFNEFAKTFNCPANSNMNPNDKCVVW